MQSRVIARRRCTLKNVSPSLEVQVKQVLIIGCVYYFGGALLKIDTFDTLAAHKSGDMH